jgi:hypothetical protein
VWVSCLSCCVCARMSRVNSGDHELAKTAEEHSVDEKDSAATPFGDDAAVDDDNDDTDCGQDARVHEWRSNLCHLEEVCSVRCATLVPIQNDTGGIVQIMYMAPEPACRVTAPTARSVRRRSIGFLKRSTISEFTAISFSASMAAFISASSASTSSGNGLNHLRALRASSSLSICKSHRGDSGMKNMPIDRRPGIT